MLSSASFTLTLLVFCSVRISNAGDCGGVGCVVGGVVVVSLFSSFANSSKKIC